MEIKFKARLSFTQEKGSRRCYGSLLVGGKNPCRDTFIIVATPLGSAAFCRRRRVEVVVVASIVHADECDSATHGLGIDVSGNTFVTVTPRPGAHPLAVAGGVEVVGDRGIPHAEQGDGATLGGFEDETCDTLPLVAQIPDGVVQLLGVGGVEVVYRLGVVGPEEWNRLPLIDTTSSSYRGSLLER